MKKMILGAAILFFALLSIGGPASAQAPGQVFCGPAIGYADVCPDDVVRPNDDPTVASSSGALPRTGSDSSLPLAKTALVLIGVGGAMTILAKRRRHLHIPA